MQTPQHPSRLRIYHWLIFGLLAAPLTASADWRDWLNKITEQPASEQTMSALSESDIAAGLKEALGKGVSNAVSQLGAEGGFLSNAKVKIPLPEHLQLVEKGLRAIGQDAYADDFITSMNRAAEQAVPTAANVFGKAISNMSIDDARGVLSGGDTAATDFLKRSSHDELKQRFRPLVDAAVNEVGVTANYQQLMDKAGGAAQLIGAETPDLTGYVTDKALDGLYLVVGEEERKIRENPAARTTELLKKVFSQ